MALVVRQAARADADAIAVFAMQLIEQHVGYDPGRFAGIGSHEGMATYYGSRTKAPNAVVLIAEEDDKPVGFAYLEYEPILYAELAVKVGWLHDIFVEPAARRTGAGRLLIDGIGERARQLGADKVLLSVAAMNVVGREFFEHQGFRTTMHEMMLSL